MGIDIDVPMYSESASPNTTTLLSTPFSNEDIAYLKRNDRAFVDNLLRDESGSLENIGSTSRTIDQGFRAASAEAEMDEDDQDGSLRRDVGARLEAGAEADNEGNIQVEINFRDPSGSIGRRWWGGRRRRRSHKEVNSQSLAPAAPESTRRSVTPHIPTSTIASPSTITHPITPPTIISTDDSVASRDYDHEHRQGTGVAVNNVVRGKQRKMTRSEKKGLREKGKGTLTVKGIPAMNIVIFIVGSRGQFLPFPAL